MVLGLWGLEISCRHAGLEMVLAGRPSVRKKAAGEVPLTLPPPGFHWCSARYWKKLASHRGGQSLVCLVPVVVALERSVRHMFS